MATKPNLNEHVSLIFELYNRIPHSRKITAKELQAQLADVGVNRDIRTIQRNLDVMVLHLSINKDTRDRPYGYHRNTLPIKTFGPRESILLNLAEGWLLKSFPLEYQATINSVFTEIHHLKTQPSSITHHRQPLVDIKTPNLLSQDYSPQFNAVFDQLAHGIVQRNIVKITLNQQELSIEPLSIQAHDHSLLIVYRLPNGEYKQIEIEQIERATLSTFHFEYPDDLNFSLLSNNYKPTRFNIT